MRTRELKKIVTGSSRIKQKRLRTQQQTNALNQLGYKFESKNDGAHFIFALDGQQLHFWPSSEKVWHEQSNLQAVGFAYLLAVLENDKEVGNE